MQILTATNNARVIYKCTEKSFLLRVAYMEIYNETVRDLLCPETGELRIHEDKKVITLKRMRILIGTTSVEYFNSF